MMNIAAMPQRTPRVMPKTSSMRRFEPSPVKVLAADEDAAANEFVGVADGIEVDDGVDDADDEVERRGAWLLLRWPVKKRPLSTQAFVFSLNRLSGLLSLPPVMTDVPSDPCATL